jgi:hypothetical protein
MHAASCRSLLLLMCRAACCCVLGFCLWFCAAAAAAQVAARVLDVLLQSNSDAILLRMGLAVMEALSSKLLELQDFEEVITYLKVCVCTHFKCDNLGVFVAGVGMDAWMQSTGNRGHVYIWACPAHAGPPAEGN